MGLLSGASHCALAEIHAAKALAEALRINTTLQEIELLYTTRGDAGREAGGRDLEVVPPCL